MCRQWSWTSLTGIKSIGLVDPLFTLPVIDGIQFIEAPHSSDDNRLVAILDLAERSPTRAVIQEHIIPAWKREQSKEWPTVLKQELAQLILPEMLCLAPGSVHDISLVPVAALDGKRTTKFATASSLIEPSNAGLTAMFFEDEEVLPEGHFATQFDLALKCLGLQTSVSERLALDRARIFASGKYP